MSQPYCINHCDVNYSNSNTAFAMYYAMCLTGLWWYAMWLSLTACIFAGRVRVHEFCLKHLLLWKRQNYPFQLSETLSGLSWISRIILTENLFKSLSYNCSSRTTLEISSSCPFFFLKFLLCVSTKLLGTIYIYEGINIFEYKTMIEKVTVNTWF